MLGNVTNKGPHAKRTGRAHLAAEIARPYLLWLAVLLVGTIGLAGWFVLQQERTAAQDVFEKTLAAVAGLKAREIEGWLKHRLGDAVVVRSSKVVHELLAAPNAPERRDAARKHFQDLLAAYDYENIQVYDARGVLLAAALADHPEQLECIAPNLSKAREARETLVVDLHRARPGSPPHMVLFCPVRAQGQSHESADGVVVLVLDPLHYLYPVIQHWPSPSRTVETLLLRREGSEVVYLNETRFCTNTALNLRLSMLQTNFPAVRAVLGERGVIKGVDYRGVPVIAAARPIGGSSWFMEVKIDQAEAFEPVRQVTWKIIVVVGLISLVTLMAFSALLRRQKLRAAQRELAGRKESEKTLRQSEARFRGLFENAHDALLVMAGPPWRVASVNPAAVRMFGASDAGELLAFQPWGPVPPLQPDGSKSSEKAGGMIAQAMQQGFSFFEWLHCRVDGQKFFAEVLLVRIEQGGRDMLQATVRDVTARKQIEAALQRREEIYSAIVSQAGDSIVLIDGPTGRFVEFNQAAHESLGYTRDEFAQMTPADIQAQYTPDEVRQHIRHTCEEGSLTFDSRHRRRDGQVVDRRVNLRGLQIQGRPLVAGVWADITERKRAEESLRESQQELQLVISTAQDAIIMINPQGCICLWNEAAVRTFGYSFDEALGRELHQVLAPERFRQTASTGFASFLHTGTGTAVGQVVELVGRRKDGSEFPMELSVAPFQLASGWHAVGILRDITTRKEAEAALKAQNEELVRFTYTVSHDLKSPLVTIQTFLGYLEKDMAKGDAVRIASDFGHIRRAAEKMLVLLDELLELSRIGRKMNPPENVRFAALVQAALEAVAGQVAERGVQIQVPNVPLLVHGDRRRLTEVFQNLIDNAVKFMGDQPAPRVELGMEEVGGEFVFYVRDNGLGIDPRHHHKLFGLFEKLHPGLPGTGMGLALVKRIVEVHGGRIWAESAGPGHGAVFRFTLRGTERLPI